jgi:hypothetical protein
MDWWHTLSEGDQIAFVALISSTFLGILGLLYAARSYWYTKRSVQLTEKSVESDLPRLQSTITCEISNPKLDLYQTRLIVDARNFGPEDIKNVSLSIDVVNPTRGWRFWQPKQVFYAAWKIPRLKSNNSLDNLLKQHSKYGSESVQVIPYKRARRLYVEDFIHHHWPMLIKKVEARPQEGVALWMDAAWYQLSRTITIDLILSEKYMVKGDTARSSLKTYRLSPITDESPGAVLKGWRIERVGS